MLHADVKSFFVVHHDAAFALFDCYAQFRCIYDFHETCTDSLTPANFANYIQILRVAENLMTSTRSTNRSPDSTSIDRGTGTSGKK
jgi:hypothetical protein